MTTRKVVFKWECLLFRFRGRVDDSRALLLNHFIGKTYLVGYNPEIFLTYFLRDRNSLN